MSSTTSPNTMALLSEYYWRYSCFLAQFLYILFSSTGEWRQAQLPGPSWASLSFCILPLNSHFPAKPWYSGTWCCTEYVFCQVTDSVVSKDLQPGVSSVWKLCAPGQGLLLLLQAVEFKKSASQRVSTSSPCFCFVLFCFSAGESASADSWTETAVDVSDACGPWEASKKQSFYHIPIKTLLNISKFQDLISISVSHILFCRINFPSSVVVLNLGHMFESPLEF